mmetsp:Transcript_72265/g.186383  ORF Transcript_72265/g.186383 Transcript_72265/m.186383 type:complete len:439 (-) Transcript_72265:251-1567(-)
MDRRSGDPRLHIQELNLGHDVPAGFLLHVALGLRGRELPDRFLPGSPRRLWLISSFRLHLVIRVDGAVIGCKLQRDVTRPLCHLEALLALPGPDEAGKGGVLEHTGQVDEEGPNDDIDWHAEPQWCVEGVVDEAPQGHHCLAMEQRRGPQRLEDDLVRPLQRVRGDVAVQLREAHVQRGAHVRQDDVHQGVCGGPVAWLPPLARQAVQSLERVEQSAAARRHLDVRRALLGPHAALYELRHTRPYSGDQCHRSDTQVVVPEAVRLPRLVVQLLLALELRQERLHRACEALKVLLDARAEPLPISHIYLARLVVFAERELRKRRNGAVDEPMADPAHEDLICLTLRHAQIGAGIGLSTLQVVRGLHEELGAETGLVGVHPDIEGRAEGLGLQMAPVVDERLHESVAELHGQQPARGELRSLTAADIASLAPRKAGGGVH